MKILHIGLALILNTPNSLCFGSSKSVTGNSTPKFTENKGQITDQQHNPRPDILYYGSTNGFAFYLRKNGISYQLSKINSWKQDSFSIQRTKPDKFDVDKKKHGLVPDEIGIYRLDINWIGINLNTTLVSDAVSQGTNSYYSGTSIDGIRNVKSLMGVTYKNIYPNIDLHYYQEKGNIKYDYIVKPHSDYKRIQLEIKGASSIELLKDGKILLRTPLGNIQEDAPTVFQSDKKLKARWIITNKNYLTFYVENYDKNKPMIIDPIIRHWGTYFGGNYDDVIISSSTDSNKNLYITGYTDSQILIATSGAHQTTFGSPGNFSWNKDAFLVKFDSNGVRLWGTYYGDWNYEEGTGCATDKLDNIYVSGYVNGSGTTTTMATPGAFKTSAGSGFLAKFNSSGIRIWSTYYFGPCGSCATDGSNNVLVTGSAQSQTTLGVFATANAHQSTFQGWSDGFLAKFDSAGQRLWSTYYGGPYEDYMAGICTDLNKNVFLSGYTNSNIGTFIASTGAHQVSTPSRNGFDYDAFLVKFDSTGIRQWGTYYGGPGFDWGYSVAADLGGNTYLVGVASGSSSFTTTNCHQALAGGNYDAFLVKFNASGIRQWGTLYGGLSDDLGGDCATDKYYNIYICGSSGSGSQIATANTYQDSTAGDWDAFIAKFDSTGNRTWGTYYGGNLADWGQTCSIDASNNLYMAGVTGSSANIASQGSFLDTIGAWTDSYIVKFSDCSFMPPQPINITPVNNQTVCANTHATLSVNNIGAINWYSNPSSTLSLSNSATFVTSFLGVGTYSFYAQATTCTTNFNRTLVTLTVEPIPNIYLSGPDTVCFGTNVTYAANGSAQQYIWSNGNSGITSSFNLISSTSITLTGIGSNNCVNSIVKSVLVNNLPYINIIGQSNICSGSSSQLSAISSAQSFTWSNGSTNYSISVTPTANSIYTIWVKDTNNCINSANKTITVNALPTLYVTSDASTVCEGEMVNLSVTGAQIFFWSNGVSGPNNPVTPSVTTTYTVTGINSTGCFDVTSITQSVTVCLSTKETVFDPNINTAPNPANNYLKIKLNQGLTPLNLKIYNSLGQTVISSALYDSETEVDIFHCPSGIYTVALFKDGVLVFLKKIIKNK